MDVANSSIARPLHIELKGALYHILSRGNDRSMMPSPRFHGIMILIKGKLR